MILSKDECRVLVCMRRVSKGGRRQILWQAQQVATLEQLFSERKQISGGVRLCLHCNKEVPEQVSFCPYCQRSISNRV
ncbi:MAG: hypothetical protein P8X63_11180 [Desulfuromonadaceae bacterium]